MGRQLALRGATAVAVVVDAVVAVLRPVLHAVAAVGREDAPRRAAPVVAVVVDGAVVAFFGRRLDAVAADPGLLAGRGAIRIVRRHRLALLAVRVLHDPVAAARTELAV